MNVLVIDVGGSHVKLCASNRPKQCRFESGVDLTPENLVKETRRLTRGWKYDVISIGYPGIVSATRAVAEPGNLGAGWVGFNFEKAFGKPVRLVNDAAMQALGGYDGGRMLYLGLGTGLGSALIADRVIIALELGCLFHPRGQSLSDLLGKRGLAARGRSVWQQDVVTVTEMLQKAFKPDYVLLGGGNAKRVDPLPPNARRGGNHKAFAGGFRLWEETVEPHDRKPSAAWRVV